MDVVDPIGKRLDDIYAFAALHAVEPVRAMDALYGYVDDLLLDGWAALVDKIFGEVDVERVPTVMLIGLLTLTKGWLRALPNRRGLFSRIEAKAEKELGPERALSCLWGLSP